MPTARGWLTAAAGLALIVTGRAFGATPLEQVGFAFLLLVVIATGLVRFRRHDLEVDRTVAPVRARAGQPVTVTLSLTNQGRGSTPLLLLDEHLPPQLQGRARFSLGGLEPGGNRRTGYVIRPPRRGRYEIGPLELDLIDPFGMAKRRGHLSGTSSLLVHPRIEHLSLPRDRGSRRTMSSSALRQLTAARGEDFYTLREYVQGDDLRKIHWPSTAKRSKPMIRQEETPWQNRASILLDDRAAAYGGDPSPAGFERAVEAAASAADLYHRSAFVYRLIMSETPGLRPGRGANHLYRSLDLLAELQASRNRGEAGLVQRLRDLQSARSPEGTLVVACGDLSTEAALGIGMCSRHFKQIVVVSIPSLRAVRDEAGATAHAAIASRLHSAGIRVITLGPSQSLAAVWTSVSGGGERSWGRKQEPA